MKTAKLRQAFLDYFKKNNHEIVASSFLIPKDDPTLLFTNAGMVQFKDVFLGNETRNYVRAASSQRCVRAGGKHNDLENVGFTARHHTFFEMLGNFSFGDYFKREAITYAWEFITKNLSLPKERLWITVYEEDDEAADIWLKEIEIDKSRFSRCREDNFWAMGEIGPCGPCSEIFYDHGPEVPGGPPGSAESEGDRYVEIWNLVFMQYNRDAAGKLIPLPKPSVDTGMGLERISAVMQGVHSNYEIDIFSSLIENIAHSINVSNLKNKSLRVIADHLRSCSFLVADGVVPSNEGRGYVLRRIMRRAIRHGFTLGSHDLFFYKLVPHLFSVMGDVLTGLKTDKKEIMQVFKKEEMQFATTLEQGLKIISKVINESNSNVISGEEVFKLYDTYGFPVDLTADIAREKNMALDLKGFEKAMLEQKERARKSNQFVVSTGNINIQSKTSFCGYDEMKSNAKIIELYKDNEKTESIQQGEEGIVVLDKTPFYAESGGQVGDQGILQYENNDFIVKGTKKINKAFVHYGIMKKGQLNIDDKIVSSIDVQRRKKTCRNHSATHLLNSALRKIIGEHVIQKGSVVDSKKLRFDFSHSEPLTEQQITDIEILVNEKIQENIEVKTLLMSMKDAIEQGAMALFSEKYDESVRVVSIGNDFSKELCGGTHVDRTGDIGLFKIVYEEGIAAGVRRIEALTGIEALKYIDSNDSLLKDLLIKLKTDKANVNKRLLQILQSNKDLEKENFELKKRIIADNNKDLINRAKEIKGIKVLSEIVDIKDIKSLREMVDQIKNQLGSAIVILGSVNNDRVNLLVGVTKDCTNKVKAQNLIKHVALQIGGTGGGKDELAQAGGNKPENLKKALNSVFVWLEENL